MAPTDGSRPRRHFDQDTRQLAWLCALAVSLLLAGPAFAGGKIIVAANGIDTNDCGSKRQPCRTITRGIAQAPEGGTVLVGPGRYGDLDRDGILGEPEEENPTCESCTILIDKRITVVSQAGAEATIIACAPDQFYGVWIRADRATFGRKKRGFTLTGNHSVTVSASGDGTRVAGNLVLAGSNGFELRGVSALARGNAAIGNYSTGFIVRAGSRATVVDNRSIGNGRGPLPNASALGISTASANATITGNVASANESIGIASLLGGDVIAKNVTVGNVPDFGGPGSGIMLGFGDPTGPVAPTRLTRNLIVGNAGPGVYADTDAASTLEKNVIYGNDVTDNCGALNDSGTTMTARKNFWGAADGPGDEPADIVCVTNGSSTWDPSPRAARIRVRAAR